MCRWMDGRAGDVGLSAGFRLNFELERTRKRRRRRMNKSELQTILGYLNIGLAIAHSTGITVGHFGSTDFIQLAQAVNGLLLESIVPAASAATTAVAAPAAVATTAPAVAVAVASTPVSSVAAAN
jgi:hypothetical protein